VDVKPLGFLISLLAHILFLLLIARMRFPMSLNVPMPQVIEIVPMSPPPAASASPPRLVFVRPFVMKGGTPGASRGDGAAGARRPFPGAGSGNAPRPSRMPADSVARQRGLPAGTSGKAPPPSPARELAMAPAAGELREESGTPSRLKIDLTSIERELRGKGAAGGPPSGGLPPSGDEGLPFGALGEGGDGTAADAMGGNAFFDSRGYDITPWAQRFVYRIKKNWIMPPASSYGLKGAVGIYLVIGRDGGIATIFIRRGSGIRPFDQAAFNAIRLSAPLPPLPDDFPRADLPAYLVFYYK
jgi:TonB family protein